MANDEFHSRRMSHSKSSDDNLSKSKKTPVLCAYTSIDCPKNSISSSIQKRKGKLTRMVSMDLGANESMHQKQLNLQQSILNSQSSQSQEDSLPVSIPATPKEEIEHVRPKNFADRRPSKSDEFLAPQVVVQRSPWQRTLQGNIHSAGVSQRSFENFRDARKSHHQSRSPSMTSNLQHQRFHFGGQPQRTSHARPRRNLSAEGWFRVQSFQKASSTSSSTPHRDKCLRFSADCIKKDKERNSSPCSHSRSISCIPLSKFRALSTSREDTKHLSRPSSGEFLDTQKSFDRWSISPHKSFEKSDSSLPESTCSKHRTPDRKCDKCSSQRSSTEKERCQSPVEASTSETRSRRSQFRRAISLFSLSCDKETDRNKEKQSQQKIWRPPTRHIYRKGMSGLPIECGSRTMTIAY